MKETEKRILDRIVFGVIGLTLIVSLAVLYGILGRDASFCAGIGENTPVAEDEPIATVSAIPEPADAYEVAHITFAGLCTPASMLGSSAFGTFQQAYAERGAAYFLDALADVFSRDDCTVAGCNAVFTDNAELPTRAKSEAEEKAWYRAPSEMAAVFASGGVEVVSTACPRAMDYGADGYADTQAALDAAGVAWSDIGRAVYQTLPGDIQTAIYCVSDAGTNGDSIRAWIAGAREANDFVAVYVTDAAEETVSDARREAYRSFAEAGADLVVGTGSQTVQETETWQRGRIVYSLGSLLDGAERYPEPYTALLSVTLKADGGAVKEIHYTFIPCRTYDDNHAWRPSVIESDEDAAPVWERLG